MKLRLLLCDAPGCKQHLVQTCMLLLLLLLSPGVLRSRLRRSKEAKLVVFFSNCDSVDFHHALLQQPQPGGGDPDSYDAAAAAGGEAGALLLGGCPVLKLHGDMKQPERTSSLVTFSKVGGRAAVGFLQYVVLLSLVDSIRECCCCVGQCCPSWCYGSLMVNSLSSFISACTFLQPLRPCPVEVFIKRAPAGA
jgi:hypothetical protein